MLGAIIGDVAGSTYEVNEVNALKEKKDNYLNRIKILNKNTPLFNKDSSYTDDSILTTAIAYSILNDGDYYKNLKEFGQREINLGLDMYGRNRFGKGFCEWVKGDYIGESYGNGCAMRISPIANYYDTFKDIRGEMIKATYPSHNNKESYIMCDLVTSCILLSKFGRSKTEIEEYIDIHYGNIVNFNLEDLQKNYKFTSRAINSVPQAVFCFLKANNFEDAIRKAISIGGDSDTIAAITGSIAEAYYGIDEELIKQVKPYLPGYIIDITNDFYKSLGKKEPFKDDKVYTKRKPI